MWAARLITNVVRPSNACPLTRWLGNGDRKDVRSLYVARGGLLADAPKGCAAGGGGASKGGTSPPVKGGGCDSKTSGSPSKEDSLVELGKTKHYGWFGFVQDHPVRVRFHPKVEEGINYQIQAELNASYYYTSLAATFGRVDVALRGLERYFWRAANQERNDALNLADYQNKRGGIVKVNCIDDPGPTARTTSAKEALANSLQLQRNLTQQLLNLYQVANDCCDPVTCDFLSESFLFKQVKRLSRNGRYITQLYRIGDSGVAIHDFDEWLFNELPGNSDVQSSIMTKHLSEYNEGERGKPKKS